MIDCELGQALYGQKRENESVHEYIARAIFALALSVEEAGKTVAAKLGAVEKKLDTIDRSISTKEDYSVVDALLDIDRTLCSSTDDSVVAALRAIAEEL